MSITAQLVGGSLDGDEFIMTPNGSVSPPWRLEYLTTASDVAGWEGYECWCDGHWESEEKALYNYTGFRPLESQLSSSERQLSEMQAMADTIKSLRKTVADRQRLVDKLHDIEANQ